MDLLAALLLMAARGPQEDGISTLLPYKVGIHWVGNPAESKAISVHLTALTLGRWTAGTAIPPATMFVIAGGFDEQAGRNLFARADRGGLDRVISRFFERTAG